MKIVGYVLVAIGLLCIPFAARQGIAALAEDGSHLIPFLLYIASSAALIGAGVFVLKKFDDATSTSRRYANSSNRIRLG
jgi:hypothetical protein